MAVYTLQGEDTEEQGPWLCRYLMFLHIRPACNHIYPSSIETAGGDTLSIWCPSIWMPYDTYDNFANVCDC